MTATAKLYSTGCYHNQIANRAANAVNEGADLTAWLIADAKTQRRDQREWATDALYNLAASNTAGATMLTGAREYFAAPRHVYSIAAE